MKSFKWKLYLSNFIQQSSFLSLSLFPNRNQNLTRFLSHEILIIYLSLPSSIYYQRNQDEKMEKLSETDKMDALIDENVEEDEYFSRSGTATALCASRVNEIEVEAGIGSGLDSKEEREREGESRLKGNVKDCSKREEEMNVKEENKGGGRDGIGLKGTKKEEEEQTLCGIVLDVVLLGAPICSTVRRFHLILLLYRIPFFFWSLHNSGAHEYRLTTDYRLCDR